MKPLTGPAGFGRPATEQLSDEVRRLRRALERIALHNYMSEESGHTWCDIAKAQADIASKELEIRPAKCPCCLRLKVPETKCPGCDECNNGPDGGPAQACEGWGSYCCRCGADFARGQM